MFSGITAGVIGGGAVLGYLGSEEASKRQADAASQAGAAVGRAGAQARSDLAPWVQTGGNANSKLAYLLGTSDGKVDETDPAFQAIYQRLISQADAAHQDRFKMSIFDDRADANLRTKEFENLKTDAIREYSRTRPAPGPDAGSLLKPFTMADLTSEPGYQFGLAEGEKGIDRAAAAGSGRYSGATLKALTRFNEEYAGTKYDAAFARDAATKNQTYNFLTGASGTGANAAAQTAGIGANSAATQAGLLTDAGNARAAGAVGGANAITGAISTGLNYYQGNSYIDALKKNTTALRGGATGTRAYSLQDEINL